MYELFGELFPDERAKLKYMNLWKDMEYSSLISGQHSQTMTGTKQ